MDKNNVPKSSSSRKISQDSHLFYRERHRSPSPTEFFRNQFLIQNHLCEREQDLNEFIYNGIQKFLDKQAVRDLIFAYDEEEIFVYGKQHFYENIFEDIQRYDNDRLNKTLNSKTNKFTQLVDQFKKSPDVKIYTTQKNADKRRKRRSSGLMITSFLTSVCVQFFRIRTKNKIRQRKESRLLEEMIERQKIIDKNNKNNNDHNKYLK